MRCCQNLLFLRHPGIQGDVWANPFLVSLKQVNGTIEAELRVLISGTDSCLNSCSTIGYFRWHPAN
jgi:hypothetical protein